MKKLIEDLGGYTSTIIFILLFVVAIWSGSMWIYTTLLGKQETNKISKAFKVGDVYRHNEYEKLVEETAEWKKYRLKSRWESNITSTFITVKNDTIVSIWRAR